jgi:rSAM/selenodomain-associated transferase 2
LIGSVSVVIPTLNAAASLADCLARLDGAREVIVVDGGSDDETRPIARQKGARLITSPPGRGAQLGAGADAATGDWLLFLHADTLLGSDWRTAAERHMTSAPDAAGYFRFRLQSNAWQARLIEAGVKLRVALLKLPYGDQALLIRRDVYDRIGGFRPLPLLEDVDLVRRLGRNRLRVIQSDAVTSAARWQQDGWLRRSARNAACLALYLAGASPERIAPLYRRGTRQRQHGVQV